MTQINFSSFYFFWPRILDTGSNEEIRESALRGADLVLLCCPVEELQILDLVVLANELKVFKEGADKERMVLVGTKSDLVKDDEKHRRGGIVPTELGLQHFPECSSSSATSVQELFQRLMDIHTLNINRTGYGENQTLIPRLYYFFYFQARVQKVPKGPKGSCRAGRMMSREF